jgi:hypothetical protein
MNRRESKTQGSYWNLVVKMTAEQLIVVFRTRSRLYLDRNKQTMNMDKGLYLTTAKQRCLFFPKYFILILA